MTRTEERRRGLGRSVVDGALHAVMLGATESYLGALAVELGHRDVALSVLTTLPLAIGAFSQLLSPTLVRWLGGEKRAVVAGVVVQALTHAAFCAIALTGTTSLGVLLAAKIVYWVSAASHAPAWSSWMIRLVPERLRGRFFARRMWVYHAALLVTFVVAGYVLRGAAARGAVLVGFGVLHVASLAARLAGAAVVGTQPSFGEPPPRARPPLRDVLKRGRWRVAIFVALVLCGAQLAMPFFTPFMLEELELDLAQFALLSAVAIGAKGASFPLMRRLAQRVGPRRVLWACGAGIAIVPTFWMGAHDVRLIVLGQLLSGAAWAGYELTSLQLLMSDAPEEAPVEFYALANALSGATQVLGAVAGGWLLQTGAFDYDAIFLGSAVARGAALLSLVVVRVPRRHVAVMIARVRTVRPSAGGMVGALVSRWRPPK